MMEANLRRANGGVPAANRKDLSTNTKMAERAAGKLGRETRDIGQLTSLRNMSGKSAFPLFRSLHHHYGMGLK